MEAVIASPEVCILVLVLGLVALLAGYTWGRRSGLDEGQKLGRTAAPIELRQFALEHNLCPICGKRLETPTQKKAENNRGSSQR